MILGERASSLCLCPAPCVNWVSPRPWRRVRCLHANASTRQVVKQLGWKCLYVRPVAPDTRGALCMLVEGGRMQVRGPGCRGQLPNLHLAAMWHRTAMLLLSPSAFANNIFAQMTW